MARVWERPSDFGDELRLPSLRDSLLFDSCLFKHLFYFCNGVEYTGQSLDAKSVLFVTDGIKTSQIFGERSKSVTDSPSVLPSHIIFHSQADIAPDWFHRHLHSLSTLGFCLGNRATTSALAQYLTQQPPHSTLHHLHTRRIDADADDDELWGPLRSLTQALNSPHCKIDGFVLEDTSPNICHLVTETLLQPQIMSDIKAGGGRACKFQCLGFINCELGEDTIEVLAKTLQSPDCKLSELSLYASCDFVANFESLQHLAMALQQGQCKLTRLDIRRCKIDKKGLILLFDSLLDSQVPIQDFGLSIADVEVMSILKGGLRRPLLQFLILRLSLGIFKEDAALSLAEALGEQNCKVCVLDLEWHNFQFPCFLQPLQQQRHKVQGLRVNCIALTSELHSAIAGFVSSNGCPLLWLEVRIQIQLGKKFDAEESSLAEALVNNYTICTFSYPWKNTAAEARASSFLKRNRLYRSGGLSEQEFVKPHAAKLFICGHAEVGKTTLRKRLLKASAPCDPYLGCGSLLPLCGTGPARTRGMELSTLSFSTPPKQLVICDLAGQQEYHAFHHYFVSGSNKDLFLVMCKSHPALLQKDLESQLEYWLRFIVCHRSSDSSATKPKVIVVLNFFYDAEDMNQISRNKCSHLLHKYRDELDFGLLGDENVFGIVATNTSHVAPLIGILENLLGQLLQNRSASIPKICDDISSYILPNLLRKGRLCGMQYSSKTLFLPSSQLHYLYHKHFHTQPEAMPSPETFQTALLELHNTGQIVFFPAPVQPAGDSPTDPLVITDCGWFSHKLIGSLLEPIEFKLSFNQRAETWVWDKEDVKQMLRRQKCEENYLDEILRYLQSIELCYPIIMPESGRQQLLFPALLRGDTPIPLVENQVDTILLGRRLKCQNMAKQLLPSGLFARLQVKLHDYCGNNSYRVRYGLICFSKDFVRVEVRFGGDTGRWEDRQWIDILISYPENRHGWTADNILRKMKLLIHEMCQAAERGCPTVLLQEFILRDNTVGSKDLALDSIRDKVLKKGINSSVEWQGGECIEAINFLLPSEIKELATQHATQQFQAVTDVQIEFSDSNERSRGSSSRCWTEVEDVSGLDKSSQKLWQLINQKLNKLDASISGSLQDLKDEICMLTDSLQQVERRIISECSTHLLTQLLETPLPLYPYLTDANGKWKKLMNAVAGERMQLHFMCEDGPHDIEKQEGLTVVVKPAEWVRRIAPVLVPALRVFCCAARLAATVYLPGSSNVFIPSPDFLQSLGLSEDALQRQILPEALKALVGGISNVGQLGGQPLQKSEVKACLSDLLRGQNVDMRRDFLLHRVVLDGQGKRQISWVCTEHALGKNLLNEVNPFA